MGSMTPQEIYENFHEQAMGVDRLGEARQGAFRLAQAFPDRAVQLKRLMDGVAEGWQGRAAQQAWQGLNPLARDFLAGGDELETSQALVIDQIGAFIAAASATEPVPAEPSPFDVLADPWSEGDSSAYQQALHYQSVANHNVDAMHAYQTASTRNTRNLPELASTLQPGFASITVDIPRRHGPHAAASDTAPVSHTAPQAVDPTGGGLPTNGTERAAHPTMPPERHAAPPPAVSHAESPPPQPREPSGVPVSATSTTPAGSASVTEPATSVADDAERRWRQSGFATPGAAHEPRGHPRGHTPTASGVEAPAPLGRTAGGISERHGSVRAPVPGVRGGRSGARHNTGVTDEPAVPKASGTPRPSTGAQGAGGVCAGRGGRSQQDAEHERKTPFAEDAEDVFAGGVPMVAPEVIGETPIEAQRRWEQRG